MRRLGIQDGDEVVVQVYWNRVPIGEITLNSISFSELAVNVYTEDESTVVLLSEAIRASAEAMAFHMAKPHLQKLIRERIDQLKADDDDREAGETDSPTEVQDIPF